jgi:pyrroline-5-carboxylate reductase
MTDFNFRKLPLAGAPPRDVSEVVNNLVDGKINAKGAVTLAQSTTTTTVSDLRVGEETVILLMPTTANAAGALATTYVSSRGTQTFTLTHANNSQTDRVFKYVCLG